MKKLIYLFLALLIVACSSDDEGNPCVYNPTLTTSAVTNVTETSATLNGVISIVSENCEDPTNTEQGFVYATTIQPTTANNKVNVNGTDITTTLENLEPNTTYYARTFLNNTLGEFYGNEVSFMTSDEPLDCEVVYLAENGITVKACDDANVGDTGVIDGVTYMVVDEAMLREMVANEEDVTKVVTTKVTDMKRLFYTGNVNIYSNFNQDISSWDVSNVTTMEAMFANCISFNQPIGIWNVSNVIVMGCTNSFCYEDSLQGMFQKAYSFNQPIDDWDVSNVVTMRRMFEKASSFNQPLENWDVSNVTDMYKMFLYAESFNQPIGNWDVSSVTNMGYLFRDSYFTQDISSWNVSNVTRMEGMFQYTNFNQDISSWDVSNVTDMNSMFSSTIFNKTIGDWDVSSVTNMYGMFRENTAFNRPIGNWDVSNVIVMSAMFQDASSFNQPIGNWDVSSVTTMDYMFQDASYFNQPIGNWDVSNVIGMNYMFAKYGSNNENTFNQNLSSWNVVNVTYCEFFNLSTPQWTLPKPIFTNCNP